MPHLQFHCSLIDNEYLDPTSVQIKIASMVSESERKFLKDVKNGKIGDYSANYRYVLKHRILGKRKTLTNDLLLINEVLEKLQSLYYYQYHEFFSSRSSTESFRTTRALGRISE
jgi:hypothetical protein